jgi:hypothetical protein
VSVTLRPDTHATGAAFLDDVELRHPGSGDIAALGD